jgi:hypothetical protein
MSTLVDAVVAETPFTLVAIVALPITSVCKGFADVAEYADFAPVIRIMLAHEAVWRCWRLYELSEWPPITMPSQRMRAFTAWRIPARRSLSFVT